MRQKKELHVLGKTSLKVQKALKLIPKKQKILDEWYFVAYAPYNFGLNATFTVDDKLVKLLRVTQQFGLEDLLVPQGWKTICKFEFPDGVPDSFTNLPTFNDWDGDGFRMKINNSLDAWRNKQNMDGWDSRPKKYR